MALLDSPESQEPTEPRPSSPLSSILPYTTVALIVALLYVGWTFYSRHEDTRRAEEEAAAKKAAANQRVVDAVYGSGALKFTRLSVSQAVLAKGESAQFCYGVVNATTVKMDPPIEQAKPTYNHCLEIAPKKTTTYTITASDASGHSEAKSLTVHVQ